MGKNCKISSHSFICEGATIEARVFIGHGVMFINDSYPGATGRTGTENIGTGLHYPIPLHLQKAYAYLGYRSGDFPGAEKLADEILSLPVYPQIAKEQQEQVIHALKQFYATRVGVGSGWISD